jgi:hypothetical protein
MLSLPGVESSNRLVVEIADVLQSKLIVCDNYLASIECYEPGFSPGLLIDDERHYSRAKTASTKTD